MKLIVPTKIQIWTNMILVNVFIIGVLNSYWWKELQFEKKIAETTFIRLFVVKSQCLAKIIQKGGKSGINYPIVQMCLRKWALSKYFNLVTSTILLMLHNLFIFYRLHLPNWRRWPTSWTCRTFLSRMSTNEKKFCQSIDSIVTPRTQRSNFSALKIR